MLNEPIKDEMKLAAAQVAAKYQHTPAPWVQDKNIIRGNGYSITAVTSYNTTEGAANASLIAAALSLLEALIELDNAMMDIDGYAGRRGTWEVVRAAIAKAKGE